MLCYEYCVLIPKSDAPLLNSNWPLRPLIGIIIEHTNFQVHNDAKVLGYRCFLCPYSQPKMWPPNNLERAPNSIN